MERTAQPPSRPGVPAGFLGMFGLIIVIEACVGRWHSLESLDVSYDWWLTNQRATRESAPVDVLCFGDSQMKLDAQPKVIEPILDRSVLNLSVIAGEAPSTYFLLRRALGSGARPKAILVDYFLPLLTGTLGMNHDRWPMVLTFSEAADLAWNAGEPDVLAHWVARRALPSYTFRAPIRHWLGIERIPNNPYDDGPILARNSAINRGAIAGQENPSFPDDPSLLPIGERPLRFGCSSVHARYLRKFLALADRHGIPVFYMLYPCSPNWQRGSTEEDPEGRYEQAIRNEVTPYAGVQVIDGRFTGYGREFFFDKSHLNHRGSAAFSADLAQILNREMGPEPTRERWISMPPHGLCAARLESLEDSRQAVLAAPDSVRR